jgi:hypothetical protein
MPHMGKATKTEVRAFATRTREHLRGMEAALKADDLELAREEAMEAAGCAGTAETLLEELTGYNGEEAFLA